MNEITKSKIEGFGSLFRIITPILLTIIGTTIIGGQSELKKEISGLKTHFVNHLMHHQDLEVGYERRITKIEETRFTSKDGEKLEKKIRESLPPKWLIDKVNTVDEKCSELRLDLKSYRKK